jgi:hypothetical protein
MTRAYLFETDKSLDDSTIDFPWITLQWMFLLQNTWITEVWSRFEMAKTNLVSRWGSHWWLYFNILHCLRIWTQLSVVLRYFSPRADKNLCSGGPIRTLAQFVWQFSLTNSCVNGCFRLAITENICDLK